MAARAILRNKTGSYVYEIIVDGIVRYIGKGTGNRAASHISLAESVNRRRDAGEVVKTQKLYNQLAKAMRANSKMLSMWRDPAVIAKSKNRAAAQWADQSARDRNREKVKSQWADPLFKGQTNRSY